MDANDQAASAGFWSLGTYQGRCSAWGWPPSRQGRRGLRSAGFGNEKGVDRLRPFEFRPAPSDVAKVRKTRAALERMGRHVPARRGAGRRKNLGVGRRCEGAKLYR